MQIIKKILKTSCTTTPSTLTDTASIMDIHQSNQLYMLSTLNSLRSGNPLIDGIFILLLPTIMTYIGQFANIIINNITLSAKKILTKNFIQQIEYTMITPPISAPC